MIDGFLFGVGILISGILAILLAFLFMYIRDRRK